MKRLLPMLLAAAGMAQAADKPLWEAGIGVGGLSLPHYRGSDERQSWLLPVPLFVYRGAIFKADRDGARAVLLDTERVEFDLSAAATAPADSGDNRARDGMPDLPGTLELGPKLNTTLARGAGWKLDLRLPLRAAFSLDRDVRHLGWTFAPVLNLDQRFGDVNLGVSAGPLWGDRRWHRVFYDVAPAYATATRPAYASRGGYAGWQGTLALSRRSGGTWMGAFVRADSVAGAVFEASPLVTSRRQWSFGFAVSWVLATSDTRVSVDD